MYVIGILTYTTVIVYRIILCFGIYNLCRNGIAGIFIFGPSKIGNSNLKLVYLKAYLAECTLIIVCTADLSSGNIAACIGYNLNLITALAVTKIFIILDGNGIAAEESGNISMRYGIAVNPLAAIKFGNLVICLSNHKIKSGLACSSIITPSIVVRVVKDENYGIAACICTANVAARLNLIKIMGSDVRNESLACISLRLDRRNGYN